MRLLCCLLLVACTRPNPNYCPDNPNKDCRIDAPFACVSHDDCAASSGTPACMPTTGACVQCTPELSGECVGTTPICSPANTCTSCVADTDCASRVCLPDGSCPAPETVLYVAPNGPDTGDCTISEPCALPRGIALADSPRTLISLKSGLYRFPNGIVIDKELTLFGRDAVFERDGTYGPTLTVGPYGRLSLYHLTIARAQGGAGGAHGIFGDNGDETLYAFNVTIRDNPGRGIFWRGGYLTVVNSRIQENTGGGIDAASRFEIVGNIIFANGRPDLPAGGLFLLSGSTLNRVEFNSLTLNTAQAGVGAAIECSGELTARNNIMSGNGSLTYMEQVGGTCMHAYSIARPGDVPDGPGNSSADPMFVDPQTGELHIMDGSPATGAADPASDLTGIAARDIDGQPRNAPADIGADEIP